MVRRILWLILAFMLPLAAEQNLFHQAQIYIDKEHLSFKEIQQRSFKDISVNHINLGFSDASVWLKFTLINHTDHAKKHLLKINNPLLEHITLHDGNQSVMSGMLHINETRIALHPSFTLFSAPKSEQTYYLHVKNRTTSLQFSATLCDTETFVYDDRGTQFLIIFLVGIVSAFLLYSFALYIYTKDVTYLYYIVYIASILFQQLTYIGFLPLYMSESFTAIDNLIVVPKLAFMIITAILFARSFLKTAMFQTIDKVYKVIIGATLAQVLLFSTPWLYVPETMILTGLFFIFFNFFAAVYVYLKGNKQARFFIAGWVFLLIGYFLMILDALGLYSVMYHLPNLVLLCTIFEAFFLLLAFADRINILQQQKMLTEHKLFEELEHRNRIVEAEVKERTLWLTNLYKELHHRVKNNLQIILSIIRLQSDKMQESLKPSFIELENRIRSIAKTHELLYQNDNTETIEMHEYITSLCEDIEASLSKKVLTFVIDVNAYMPLKEAVYVGLIVNELVSNAIKYAVHGNTLTITLQSDQSQHYHLHVSDNGKGYEEEKAAPESLGLKLVSALVKEQLGGTIEAHHNDTCSYDIRFNI